MYISFALFSFPIEDILQYKVNIYIYVYISKNIVIILLQKKYPRPSFEIFICTIEIVYTEYRT